MHLALKRVNKKLESLNKIIVSGLDRSEMYKTAELLVFSDPDEEQDIVVDETRCDMDTDSNSGVGWGLTLPSLAEDSNINTESRVDTGYTTSTISSIHPSNFQVVKETGHVL